MLCRTFFSLAGSVGRGMWTAIFSLLCKCRCGLTRFVDLGSRCFPCFHAFQIGQTPPRGSSSQCLLQHSVMSAALECHQLRHYSDFETGSESGVSDLSFVHPYQPQKLTKRSKPVETPVLRVSRRGARATRRLENEAFLNNLTVITEADLEEASRVAWPESVSHCSAFTKLFEDESIRAIWDKFITLSETEQNRLLGSFYGRSNWSHSDVDLDEVNEDYPEEDNGVNFNKRVNRRRQNKTGLRSSQPGAGSRKSGSHSGSGDNECAATGSLTSAAATPDSILDTGASENRDGCQSQLELRDPLCRRFANLLSKSHNHFPLNGRRKNSRRIRRAITSLDLCLIHRVETELRDWFSHQRTLVAGDSRRNPGRWTPTMSLVSRSDPERSARSPSPPSNTTQLLRLDSFERLLVHSIASYLNLFSYSAWSDKLGERQIWVELRMGQPFHPPEHTFVSLIEAKLTSVA